MTATFAPMTSLLQPPQRPLTRRGRVSTQPDSLHLSDSFWGAVKLESPLFEDLDFNNDPIEDKKSTVRVMSVEDTKTMIDDPIVAFETLDCYSPNRPTFTPAPPYDELDILQHDFMSRPCPYGEPLDLHITPAPTLASIRFNEKPPSRRSTPWSGMTLRPTRFRKDSEARQQPTMLALASAFLDSISRLGRSRSSTPIETTKPRPVDVQILESSVLINVIEDGKRAGVCEGQSLCSEFEKALEKLDLAPLSATWPSEDHVASADAGETPAREPWTGRGRTLAV